MLLTIRLLKSMLEIKLINDIDYEDIYDNVDDFTNNLIPLLNE